MASLREIFGLFPKVSSDGSVDKETSGLLNKFAVSYLQTLKRWAKIAIIVPTLLLVLGMATQQIVFIGLAGLVLCVMSCLILFSFYPLIGFLQLVLSFVNKITSAGDLKSLAHRYVNSVLTVLLLQCFATLYLMVFPVAFDPAMIVMLLVCFVVLLLLSLRYSSFMGGFIRGITFIMVIAVLIFSAMTVMLPNSMAEIRNSMPRIDQEFRNNLRGATDFETRRQQELESARQAAARAESQAREERRNRLSAEEHARQSRQAEQRRLQESQVAIRAQAEREAREAAEAQRVAEARADLAERNAEAYRQSQAYAERQRQVERDRYDAQQQRDAALRAQADVERDRREAREARNRAEQDRKDAQEAREQARQERLAMQQQQQRQPPVYYIPQPRYAVPPEFRPRPRPMPMPPRICPPPQRRPMPPHPPRGRR